MTDTVEHMTMEEKRSAMDGFFGRVGKKYAGERAAHPAPDDEEVESLGHGGGGSASNDFRSGISLSLTPARQALVRIIESKSDLEAQTAIENMRHQFPGIMDAVLEYDEASNALIEEFAEEIINDHAQ